MLSFLYCQGVISMQLLHMENNAPFVSFTHITGYDEQFTKYLNDFLRNKIIGKLPDNLMTHAHLQALNGKFDEKQTSTYFWKTTAYACDIISNCASLAMIAIPTLSTLFDNKDIQMLLRMNIVNISAGVISLIFGKMQVYSANKIAQLEAYLFYVQALKSNYNVAISKAAAVNQLNNGTTPNEDALTTNVINENAASDQLNNETIVHDDALTSIAIHENVA